MYKISHSNLAFTYLPVPLLCLSYVQEYPELHYSSVNIWWLTRSPISTATTITHVHDMGQGLSLTLWGLVSFPLVCELLKDKNHLHFSVSPQSLTSLEFPGYLLIDEFTRQLFNLSLWDTCQTVHVSHMHSCAEGKSLNSCNPTNCTCI